MFIFSTVEGALLKPAAKAFIGRTERHTSVMERVVEKCLKSGGGRQNYPGHLSIPIPRWIQTCLHLVCGGRWDV
jgi:hypothetical protein